MQPKRAKCRRTGRLVSTTYSSVMPGSGSGGGGGGGYERAKCVFFLFKYSPSISLPAVQPRAPTRFEKQPCGRRRARSTLR